MRGRHGRHSHVVKDTGPGFSDTLIRVVSVSDLMLDGLNLTPAVLDYLVCHHRGAETAE